MSETSKAEMIPIDNAFRFAVIQGWDDLAKVTTPRSVSVEYLCEPGAPLDHASVWLMKAGGYQDLVCECWRWASLAHPSGACFANKHYSNRLAQALGFIMKNQSLFTRPADAGRHGLVLINPPDADDRREAASWMRVVEGLESEISGGEAPPDDHRQDEEAWSRMDDEGYPHECSVILPDPTGSSKIGEATLGG